MAKTKEKKAANAAATDGAQVTAPKTPEQAALATEPAAPAQTIPQPPALSAPKPTAAALDDIEVQDAEIFRPKALPFLITSKEGWKNEAQTEYAGYLNAYAYSNPEKFKLKKATLLARLVEIGNDPSAIVKYRGNKSAVAFKNHLTEGPEAAARG